MHHQQFSEYKSITLLIPGLNLKASKMSAIAKVLTEQGHEVIIAELAGHKETPENLLEQKKVNRETWLKDIEHYFHKASKKSIQRKVPFYICAYSLGALLVIDFIKEELINQKNTNLLVRPDKLFFLAPALATRWYTYLLKLLFFLPSSIGIPSKNHADYRVENRTTLACYRALEKSLNSIEKLNQYQQKFINIPAIIMVDTQDELIDVKKLKQFIKKNHLSSWQLKEISKKIGRRRHHLIIDKKSLGATDWKKLKKDLAEHFGTH